MKKEIKLAYENEIFIAKKAYLEDDLILAFEHLERAHILGQRHFFYHFSTHWWMLKVGVKTASSKDIFGQIIRLVAVFPGFIFGWVPKGNTGGANVSALKPMDIPKDLEVILGNPSVWRGIFLRVILFAIAIIMFTLS